MNSVNIGKVIGVLEDMQNANIIAKFAIGGAKDFQIPEKWRKWQKARLEIS